MKVYVSTGLVKDKPTLKFTRELIKNKITFIEFS